MGQDVYRTGRVAAELMGKSVPPGARVLATVGNRKFHGHQKRLQGFLDRMEELGFDRGQILVGETFNDYKNTRSRVVLPGSGGYLHGESQRVRLRRGRPRPRGEGRVQGDLPRHQRRHPPAAAGRQRGLHHPQDFIQQGYAPILLLKDLLRKGKLPDPARFAGRIGILCR